jgi:hypothetical protein
MELIVPLTWTVENLRMTAFGQPFKGANTAEYWNQLEAGPASQLMHTSINGQGSADGEVNGIPCNVTACDHIELAGTSAGFLQLSTHGKPEKLGEFPALGPWAAASEHFMGLAQKLFTSEFTCSRLAFGAHLIFPVADAVEAYALVKPMLEKSIIWDDQAADLLFQITRRMGSKTISDATINRLAQWSCVGQRTMIKINQPIFGTPGAAFSQTMQSSSVLTLMLDINSTLETNLEKEPADRLHAFFKELVDLGKETAERGDFQ